MCVCVCVCVRVFVGERERRRGGGWGKGGKQTDRWADRKTKSFLSVVFSSV